MTRLDPLRPPLQRDTNVRHRGLDLVARIAAAGVTVKGRGQRWSSGVFLSWASFYVVASKCNVFGTHRAPRKRRAA
jgi:hypothetical protein